MDVCLARKIGCGAEMKLLCHLVHPAHYHLFRKTVETLRGKGWETIYTIRNKDVLKELLDHDSYSYVNVGSDSLNRYKRMLDRFRNLKLVADNFKPDMIISSAPEAAYVGLFSNIPNLIFFEDDLQAVKPWAFFTAPVAGVLVCPESCSAWHWERKVIKYNGYHELAYLDREGENSSEQNNSKKKILLRLARLNAYHDSKNPGIDDELAYDIIKIAEKYGTVYISSERKLREDIQKYIVKIHPSEMIDFMKTLDLYIGDSQTMAAEAAVLGIPSIRYNNFVGKLGYLEELESKYSLTIGIKQGEKEKLLTALTDTLRSEDLKTVWKKRRQKMLDEKINVTDYFVHLIENYPQSIMSYKIDKKNKQISSAL